jgi:hypothetical protein
MRRLRIVVFCILLLTIIGLVVFNALFRGKRFVITKESFYPVATLEKREHTGYVILSEREFQDRLRHYGYEELPANFARVDFNRECIVVTENARLLGLIKPPRANRTVTVTRYVSTNGVGISIVEGHPEQPVHFVVGEILD